MSDPVSIRATVGWTTFVMLANLKTVKQLLESNITSSLYVNGEKVEFVENQSLIDPRIPRIYARLVLDVEVIKDSDYPSLLRSEVEEKIAQLAEEAAQDLENKDDESALVEYNETN